jgi:hypothetical protein
MKISLSTDGENKSRRLHRALLYERQLAADGAASIAEALKSRRSSFWKENVAVVASYCRIKS